MANFEDRNRETKREDPKEKERQGTPGQREGGETPYSREGQGKEPSEQTGPGTTGSRSERDRESGNPGSEPKDRGANEE